VKTCELKQILGIAVQSLKLASDTTLLKLIRHINFEQVRDHADLIAAVNASGMLRQSFSYSTIYEANEELERHIALGIKVIPIGEKFYPTSLSSIQNPPALLYLRGALEALAAGPGVSVVGSREVSSNGLEITKRITTTLCKYDFSIISGLAIGVDAMAHRAALQSKGITIAVLAHGLDEAKPKQNARLGDEILESGGAWVSEYPLGRQALKQSFVQRNRIQVGLSAGSVLVEASLGSGTMTQAEFCSQAKRPMYAVVPHEASNPLQLNCEGTLELVKTGKAFPLKTKADYEQLVDSMTQSRTEIRANVQLAAKTVPLF
jgi:DNA processing protein